MVESPRAQRHRTKRRILRNTSANAIAQGASMVSSFVFVPLLLRAFGVSSYGVMVLAASIASFSTVLDLGVGAVLVRLVAERAALGDHAGVRRAERSATVFYGLVGIGVTAGLLLLARFGHLLFTLTLEQAASMRVMLELTAISQLVFWPASASRNALAGLQRLELLSGLSLAVLAADILGMIAVISMHLGPVVLIAIRAGLTVITSVLYIVLFRRVAPRSPERVRVSIDDIRGMLKSGWSIFALTVAALLGRQQADKIILGVFIGPAAVGLYEIASKLVTLVTTVSGLSASAVLPVAAELNAVDDQDAVRSLFVRGTKILVTLVVPIIAVLIGLAAPLIAKWCGPQYAVIVPAAQVLLFAQLPLPLYELGDQMLIAKDRFGAVVPAGVSSAVLNVVLSLVLVKIFGPVGVALGTLIALYVEFPLFAIILSRELELPLRHWLRLTAWPLYPLAVLPACLAAIAGTTILGRTLLGLAAVGSTTLLLYWSVALVTAYSSVERKDLLSLIARPASAEVDG